MGGKRKIKHKPSSNSVPSMNSESTPSVTPESTPNATPIKTPVKKQIIYEITPQFKKVYARKPVYDVIFKENDYKNTVKLTHECLEKISKLSEMSLGQLAGYIMLKSQKTSESITKEFSYSELRNNQSIIDIFDRIKEYSIVMKSGNVIDITKFSLLKIIKLLGISDIFGFVNYLQIIYCSNEEIISKRSNFSSKLSKNMIAMERRHLIEENEKEPIFIIRKQTESEEKMKKVNLGGINVNLQTVISKIDEIKKLIEKKKNEIENYRKDNKYANINKKYYVKLSQVQSILRQIKSEPNDISVNLSDKDGKQIRSTKGQLTEGLKNPKYLRIKQRGKGNEMLVKDDDFVGILNKWTCTNDKEKILNIYYDKDCLVSFKDIDLDSIEFKEKEVKNNFSQESREDKKTEHLNKDKKTDQLNETKKNQLNEIKNNLEQSVAKDTALLYEVEKGKVFPKVAVEKIKSEKAEKVTLVNVGDGKSETVSKSSFGKVKEGAVEYILVIYKGKKHIVRKEEFVSSVKKCNDLESEISLVDYKGKKINGKIGDFEVDTSLVASYKPAAEAKVKENKVLKEKIISEFDINEKTETKEEAKAQKLRGALPFKRPTKTNFIIRRAVIKLTPRD